MKKCTLFIIPILFLLHGTANADFYKWEDESGATHITDYPPPQADATKNIKVHKDTSDKSSATEEDEASREAKTKAQKKTDITLYTKNDCADCDKARDFLKSQNLNFTEYNMDKDKTAAAKRKEIDESEDVPFAIINRHQVYGFTESVYNRALKSKP